MSRFVIGCYPTVETVVAPLLRTDSGSGSVDVGVGVGEVVDDFVCGLEEFVGGVEELRRRLHSWEGEMT